MQSMAKIADFLPQVVSFLPGCSEPLAAKHVLEICRDFCQFAGIWQQTLDPVSTVYGMRTYDLSPPIGANIVSVTKAWHRNIEIKVINGDARSIRPELYNDSFQGAGNNPGTPRLLLVDFENSAMVLDPPPSTTEDNALTIRVVLKPSRTAQSVPNLLLEEYEYAISQGAIARIASVPSQPFTDKQAALIANVEYLKARADAAIRANKTFARSQSAVRPRPFA
jgi:hypothetical protein